MVTLLSPYGLDGTLSLGRQSCRTTTLHSAAPVIFVDQLCITFTCSIVNCKSDDIRPTARLHDPLASPLHIHLCRLQRVQNPLQLPPPPQGLSRGLLTASRTPRRTTSAPSAFRRRHPPPPWPASRRPTTRHRQAACGKRGRS